MIYELERAIPITCKIEYWLMRDLPVKCQDRRRRTPGRRFMRAVGGTSAKQQKVVDPATGEVLGPALHLGLRGVKSSRPMQSKGKANPDTSRSLSVLPQAPQVKVNNRNPLEEPRVGGICHSSRGLRDQKNNLCQVIVL